MRKRNEILRKPDDEAGSADVGDESATSTSKRKNVSKRHFLNAAGETAVGDDAVRIEDAKGARYTLLDPNGNHDLDYTFGENENVDRMFALFGYHTKIGNVANTVLNDKDEPGTPTDAAAAIREFLAGLASGTWAERAAGGPGARVDRDALAGAIVEVAEAAGKTADYATVRQKLEEDSGYLRMARQVPAVAQAYATRVGKATKSIDDLI